MDVWTSVKINVCKKCKHFWTPIHRSNEKTAHCWLVLCMGASKIAEIKPTGKYRINNNFEIPENCPYLLEHTIAQ